MALPQTKPISTLLPVENAGSKSTAHILIRWTWLLLALSAAAVYPALTRNIGALSDDAGTVHLYRSFVFSGAISDGVLYPRWAQFLHLGAGSPLFGFNPNLPYYALDVLYRLGFPHPVGWRILIGVGLLAAGVGAYLLVRLVTGRRWPALLAAVAYLYAPYVIRNAVERGSLETFSMFLYPWILWALLSLARRPTAVRLIVATLLWTLCIGSHILGPLMLAPFAGLLALAAVWRGRNFLPLLALIAGGLLTTHISLPIADELENVAAQRQYVAVEADSALLLATPLYHPIPVDELLAPPVVYDVSSDNNGSGDGVGILQTLLLVLSIPAAMSAWRQRRRPLALAIAAAAGSGWLLFWMFTASSDPVWRAFGPLLNSLEFRTRWMGLQALAAAVAGGLSLAVLPQRWQRNTGLFLAVLLVAAALPSLYVELQHRYAPFGDSLSWPEVRDAEIRSGGTALTSWNEFGPRWRTEPFGEVLLKELGGPGFDAEADPLAGPPSGVAVEDARVQSSRWDLELSVPEPATVTLNLLYYPRWRSTVDGVPAPLAPQPGTGFAQLALPAGKHRVVLNYGMTAAEWAGIGLGSVALLGLVGAVIMRRRLVRGASEAAVTCVGAAELAPPVWFLVGLTLALVVKILYVDGSTTWMRCVSTAEQVCGAEAVVDVPFQEAPRLRGYHVSGYQVARGDDLVVDVFWEGNSSTRRHLLSFAHVRNSQPNGAMNPRTGSEIWAQADHETPGNLLAWEFEPGKLYKDHFRLALPADMPPGEYRLEIGWFDPVAGEQMDPAADAVHAPLGILWRSVLLPPLQVR